jgi:KDO2-lipid IV(A) lauroyltransferase
MGSGRPSLWTRLRWRAEQGFVLIGVTLLRALPYEAGEALMRLAGRGFFWISRSRRRIALENLRLAFGAEKSEDERRRIAIGSFEHAFLLLYEVLVRHRIVPDLAAFRARTRIFGDEPSIREELARKRGGFLLTAHFGSWETAGAYLAYEGLPFAAIARSVPNPYVQELLMGTRSRQFRVFLKIGAVADSVRTIREGTWVAVLGDQNAGRHGVFVPFFGIPASTYPLVASLALRHGFPVYFGAAVRVGPRFRYDFDIRRYDPPEGLGFDAGRDHLLRAYHAWLEGLLRRWPEQYFWMHRRWKTRPKDEAPGPLVPQYEHRGPREKPA